MGRFHISWSCFTASRKLQQQPHIVIMAELPQDLPTEPTPQVSADPAPQPQPARIPDQTPSPEPQDQSEPREELVGGGPSPQSPPQDENEEHANPPPMEEEKDPIRDIFSVQSSVRVIAELNKKLPPGLKFQIPNQLPGTVPVQPSRASRATYSSSRPSKRKKISVSDLNKQNNVSFPSQSHSDDFDNEDDYYSRPNPKRSSREKKPNPKHDLGYVEPRISSSGRIVRNLGNQIPSEAYKRCERLLLTIKRHKYSAPFLEPVDPDALGIPDYFDIIEEPMDLSTVEKNLKSGAYTNSSQFGGDMRLIWSNSLTYNGVDTDIHQMTVEIKQYFERLFKDLDNQDMFLPPGAYDPDMEMAQDLSEPMGMSEANSRRPNKRNRPKQNKKKARSDYDYDYDEEDREMTSSEKNYLGKNIKMLDQKYLHGIIEMMKDMNSSNNNQVLEFDIDKLPNHKLRQLERYVNESLINSGKTPHRVKAARDRAAQRKKAAQGKTTQKRDVSPHGKMVAEPRKHVKMTGESSSSGDEKGGAGAGQKDTNAAAAAAAMFQDKGKEDQMRAMQQMDYMAPNSQYMMYMPQQQNTQMSGVSQGSSQAYMQQYTPQQQQQLQQMMYQQSQYPQYSQQMKQQDPMWQYNVQQGQQDYLQQLQQQYYSIQGKQGMNRPNQ